MSITDRPLTVETGLRPADYGGMVILSSDGEHSLSLTPDQARSFALALMDAAARAEAESILARWLNGIPDMDDAKRAAAFGDFRKLAAADLFKSVHKAHTQALKRDTEDP